MWLQLGVVDGISRQCTSSLRLATGRDVGYTSPPTRNSSGPKPAFEMKRGVLIVESFPRSHSLSAEMIRRHESARQYRRHGRSFPAIKSMSSEMKECPCDTNDLRQKLRNQQCQQNKIIGGRWCWNRLGATNDRSKTLLYCIYRRGSEVSLHLLAKYLHSLLCLRHILLEPLESFFDGHTFRLFAFRIPLLLPFCRLLLSFLFADSLCLHSSSSLSNIFGCGLSSLYQTNGR